MCNGFSCTGENKRNSGLNPDGVSGSGCRRRPNHYTSRVKEFAFLIPLSIYILFDCYYCYCLNIYLRDYWYIFICTKVIEKIFKTQFTPLLGLLPHLRDLQTWFCWRSSLFYWESYVELESEAGGYWAQFCLRCLLLRMQRLDIMEEWSVDCIVVFGLKGVDRLKPASLRLSTGWS